LSYFKKKHEFSRQIFKKYLNIKFIEIYLLGADFVYVDGETDGLTERHGGTKCRFLQFCDRVKKTN